MKVFLEVVWLILKLTYYYFEALVLLFTKPKKKDVSGRTVLITGGGGGLGKQLAIQFAKHGARIVLWDVDTDAADRTVAIIREMNADAFAYYCDCRNEDEVAKMARKITKEIGPVDILINNAGILNGKSLLMLSTDEIRRTFDVNVLAHFWTLKAFLPTMIEKNEGHIVTISSSAGLSGTPYLSDYSASKFALLGIHESMFLELRDNGIDGVKFTIVCPNFINTGMSWYPKTKVPWLLPILDAEDVAKEILIAVRTNQQLLVLPKALIPLVSLKSLVPTKGGLAIYDWTGLGIEPHIPLSRKRQLKKQSEKSKQI
ncbi:epidermal retinol dehydrogenase 2-like [Rhopilema esculentum]|uniref:epidermal retinol dehydrogenase 2-like n=1 Tax=Rhopilema esculentum TaxID=499914 RepID=UPI0031DE46C1|eukprot:gene8595-14606_t